MSTRRLDLERLDDADRALVDRVRPAGWQNPVPAPSYDLVVLGGGTAGLVAAVGAAGLGARVALVERHRLGGDCLNTGCVPSKALLRSARAAGEVRRAHAFGVATGPPRVDFDLVMARVRQRRARIAGNDAASRLAALGVDVFFGAGRFRDARTVAVDGHALRFRRAVIATGGRPAAPPIPGLDGVPYLTNDTMFELTALPRRLLVIGAGPVGCELAQAAARLGAEVIVFDQAPRVLPRDDEDAARLVRGHLESDGVRFVLDARIERISRAPGELRLQYVRRTTHEVTSASAAGDGLLVATGRTPNIDDLGCDAAGIDVDRRGVVVNDRLQTSNRRVFASGDVCSEYKFTHAADAMSRIVLQNALFYGRRRASALIIPWVTYTDPEVAQVGLTAADAARDERRVATVTVDLSEVDRAVVDDETAGFVRVHHERGRIRGGTIVAPHAGEMIGELAYAMSRGGTLNELSAVVHPYPTYAESFRKAGDAYRRQSLTPALRRWLGRYFAWTR